MTAKRFIVAVMQLNFTFCLISAWPSQREFLRKTLHPTRTTWRGSFILYSLIKGKFMKKMASNPPKAMWRLLSREGLFLKSQFMKEIAQGRACTIFVDTKWPLRWVRREQLNTELICSGCSEYSSDALLYQLDLTISVHGTSERDQSPLQWEVLPGNRGHLGA